MARSRSGSEMQFIYWDLNRKGMTQSQIARDHGITRQAVNKSLKLYQGEMMYRLQEISQATGSLVEWTDPSRGILVGITPQLDNRRFMIVIDYRNRPRIFFDQSWSENRVNARFIMEDLKNTLRAALDIDIRGEVTFRTIPREVHG